jgi:hypothetical protein
VIFGGGRGGLERRVADGIATLPAWQIFVGSRWVCPFCLFLVRPLGREGREQVEAPADHLEECKGFRGGEGVERSLAELNRFAGYRRLRRMCKQALLRSPSWQLLDVSRSWVCPYCALATEVSVPSSSRMNDETLVGIVDHVESCSGYARGKGQEQQLGKLKDSIRRTNQVSQLAETVRVKLEGDPAWRRRDRQGAWICPYCTHSQAKVDLSTGVAMFEQAPGQIAQHLRSCAPYQEGQAPQPYEGLTSRSSGQMGIVTEEDFASGSDRWSEPNQTFKRRPAPAPVDEDLFGNEDEPLRYDGLPMAEVSETGPVGSGAHWGRDGRVAVDTDPAGHTLSELESSGEFLLIDDPEIRNLTKKGAGAELDSWREEIERSLASVRSSTSSRMGRLKAEEPALRPATPALDFRSFGIELGRVERRMDPPRGDFARVIELGRGRVALVAGAVTGDEAEVPTIAQLASRLIAEQAGPDADPADVLRAVNRAIFSDLDGRSFAAVSYALVDLSSARIRLARAGGPEPLVMHPQHGLSALASEGMVMGVDKGPAFEHNLEVCSIQLRRDDLLVLYCGGILEARGSKGDAMTIEGVKALVERYGTHEVEYFTDKFLEYFELHVEGSYRGAEACLVALRRS